MMPRGVDEYDPNDVATRPHYLAEHFGYRFGPSSTGIAVPVFAFFAAGVAVNAAADDLADLIAAAAQRAGAEFVDVRGAFTGHELCRPQEWIHGVSWPVDSSFHPTTRGHTAYAQALAPLAAQARPPAPTLSLIHI